MILTRSIQNMQMNKIGGFVVGGKLGMKTRFDGIGCKTEFFDHSLAQTLQPIFYRKHILTASKHRHFYIIPFSLMQILFFRVKNPAILRVRHARGARKA